MSSINYLTTEVDGLKVFYRQQAMQMHLSFCCCTVFRLLAECSAISARYSPRNTALFFAFQAQKH